VARPTCSELRASPYPSVRDIRCTEQTGDDDQDVPGECRVRTRPGGEFGRRRRPEELEPIGVDGVGPQLCVEHGGADGDRTGTGQHRARRRGAPGHYGQDGDDGRGDGEHGGAQCGRSDPGRGGRSVHGSDGLQNGRRRHSQTPDETEDDRDDASPPSACGIGFLQNRRAGAAGRGNAFGLGSTPVRGSSR
jgi:hypothetical protein